MLDELIIKQLKQISTNIVEGTEAVVYICDDKVLKEFKHNEKGLYNKKVFNNNSVVKNIALLNNIKKNTNTLCDKYGVNTPRILDYYTSVVNERTISYLLMERAKGRPVFARKYSMLKSYSYNNDMNKLDEKSFLTEYYKNTIKILYEAPQIHFDKFAKDCLIIEKDSKAQLDIWGENILYNSENGFSNIDIRIDCVKKEKLTELKLANRVCKACLDYIGFLNEELDKNSLQKGYEILKTQLCSVLLKSVKALKKIGIKKSNIKEYCNYDRISNLHFYKPKQIKSKKL